MPSERTKWLRRCINFCISFIIEALSLQRYFSINKLRAKKDEDSPSSFTNQTYPALYVRGSATPGSQLELSYVFRKSCLAVLTCVSIYFHNTQSSFINGTGATST